MNRTLRTRHLNVLILATGICAASIITLSPAAHRTNLRVDAVRAKEYVSLQGLEADSSTTAVLKQISDARKEHIRDYDYSVADFRVLSKSQRGMTLTILLPTDEPTQRSIRNSRVLAYLTPLTFGDSVNYNRFVFVGDGAGIFVSDGIANQFRRSDHESAKLPDSVTPQQLHVEA